MLEIESHPRVDLDIVDALSFTQKKTGQRQVTITTRGVGVSPVLYGPAVYEAATAIVDRLLDGEAISPYGFGALTRRGSC